MLWLMKLCFVAQVALGIQQRDVYAGNITWEPTQIPLVFGEDVGIRCTYHNTLSCNDPITWTWYIGTDNDLILTNGTLTEKFKSEHKYSEITSTCLQISTLIVSNFSERDYNQTYTCGIANHKQSGHLFAENIKNKITFENISYEYVPSDEMISIEIKLLPNQKILFGVEIDTVYPLPECKATIKNEDITTGLNIQKKKKSIFYHVYISLTLNHTSVEYVRSICIICKGTKSCWYLTKSWNPFCTDKPTTDKSGVFLAVCVNVFSMSYLVSSTVALLVLFFSRNDTFKNRMKKLDILDQFHCVWAAGILFGYLGTSFTDNRDTFRQQVQYGYVFNIITRIGEVKCVPFVVGVIMCGMTSVKGINKMHQVDLAASLTYLLSTAVTSLLILLLETEGKDVSKATHSTWVDLFAVQLFIPAKSLCCYMLRKFNNTEDTEDKVGDKKRETHVILMDKEQDAESYGSGSSKTHVLLMDKEQDAESYGSGSSGSYNTAYECSNDEEMCSAESEF